jgi:hypothetical protein
VFAGCSKLKAISVHPKNRRYKDINGVLLTKDGKTLHSYPAGGETVYAMPSGVTAIGEKAFSGCSNLASVNIPASATSIETGAFCGCPKLKAISVHPENQWYKDIDDVLFTKDGKTLLSCPAGRGSVYPIPPGVTTIKECAFYGCRSLTSVNIPSRATIIDVQIFYGRSSPTSIDIPSGVTIIWAEAFRDCSSLTSVDIPASVTFIKPGVFSACSRLKVIRVHPENRVYKDIEGVLFSKDGKALLSYPGGGAAIYTHPPRRYDL